MSLGSSAERGSCTRSGVGSYRVCQGWLSVEDRRNEQQVDVEEVVLLIQLLHSFLSPLFLSFNLERDRGFILISSSLFLKTTSIHMLIWVYVCYFSNRAEGGYLLDFCGVVTVNSHIRTFVCTKSITIFDCKYSFVTSGRQWSFNIHLGRGVVQVHSLVLEEIFHINSYCKTSSSSQHQYGFL